MSDTLGLRARWVLAEEGGRSVLLPDATVVVRDGKVHAVMPAGAEGAPDDTRNLGAHLLMPGFINSHTHCVSGPLFRAVLEDRDYTSGGGSIISDVMMPLGRIISALCDEDDIRAIAALGQLEALCTGSTMIVDMPRADHDGFALAAADIGLRAQIHPYLMSPPGAEWRLDAQGDDGDAGLETFLRWHARFDGGTSGRIRIGLGPHAPDTCAPDLLRRIARARDRHGAPVTIHLAQSADEVAQIEARLGMSPVDYLDRVGLLQGGLVAAHCSDATDADLALMASRGVVVAHCPLSYARIARMVSRQRFLDHGLRCTVASDAHALDIVADLRLAAINAKYATGKVAAASAHAMVAAATAEAADALQRSDLGRIRPGATADLIAIRMDRAHLQPVYDPIKTLVWNGSGQDVDFAMVDGEVLLRDGRFLRADAAAIVARGAAVIDRVWERARAQGII